MVVSNSRDKILVVGAGPTGLTLGVELARNGIIPTLIDKRDEASGFSRAVGILPKSLELLKPSGVTESLLKEAVHIQTARIFDERNLHAEVEISPSTIKFGHGLIAGLAQDRTEFLMTKQFERFGGKVEYGTELKSLQQKEDGVFVKFADGKETLFDYVVGADSVKSVVRDALDLEYRGYELPEKWSIADVISTDWPYKNCFTINLQAMGVIAIAVPLEETRYRIISNTEDALATFSIPLKIDKVIRQGSFKISVRQVESYQKGRVFLAGDAAHCHSPVGGRGMNLGIADACDLAQRFVDGDLESYSDARHKAGASIIAVTERGRKIISSKNPYLRKSLLFIVRNLMRFKFFQKRFSNVMLYGGQT